MSGPENDNFPLLYVMKWYFVTKIVLTYCENFFFQKLLSDREKLLKFEAEGREFEMSLRSLEQFILTVGQNNFGNKILFLEYYQFLFADSNS